eukprot:1049486-Prorocentrum_minimum.AAC.1
MSDHTAKALRRALVCSTNGPTTIWRLQWISQPPTNAHIAPQMQKTTRSLPKTLKSILIVSLPRSADKSGECSPPPSYLLAGRVRIRSPPLLSQPRCQLAVLLHHMFVKLLRRGDASE